MGRAKGAGNSGDMQLSIRIATRYNLMLAAVYSLLFLLFGEALIRLLTDIDDIIDYATAFLPWIVALPIIACWCYLYDGIYIGLTQAKAMRNTMLVSTFLVFFPTWFILKDFGNHGLWAAFCCFMASRGIALYWHYQRHFASTSTTN